MSNIAEETANERSAATIEQLEQEGDGRRLPRGAAGHRGHRRRPRLGCPRGSRPMCRWRTRTGALRLLADPDTVQALQELTRIAVQTKTGRFSRLILDVGGSRDARRRQLEKLVDRAIARLDEGASQASLPAMSSYERKLIHDIVADRGLVSESYGEARPAHGDPPRLRAGVSRETW